MRWLINQTIKDDHVVRGKSSICLNPNQTLHPHSIEFPIIWKGLLNNSQITISLNENDQFEYLKFPNDFDYLKQEIQNLIDEKMRMVD